MLTIRWWLEVEANHRARLDHREVAAQRHLEAGGQDGLAAALVEVALAAVAVVAAPLETVEARHLVDLVALATMAMTMTMEATTGIEM
jgi:hypothetical protein